MIRLYWLSEDGQAELPMGEWPEDWQGDREQTEADALRDMLSQCGSDTERAAVGAGSFHWVVDEYEEG